MFLGGSVLAQQSWHRQRLQMLLLWGWGKLDPDFEWMLEAVFGRLVERCFGEPGLLFPAAIGLGETAAAPEAVEWTVLPGMYFVAGAVPVRTVRGEAHYLVEPGRHLSHAVRTIGILGHCLTVDA